jgi:hypothetical protein
VTSGRQVANMVMNLQVSSSVENLRLTKEVLTSEEGLCSLELVNHLVNVFVCLFVCYQSCLCTIQSIILESSVSGVSVTDS